MVEDQTLYGCYAYSVHEFVAINFFRNCSVASLAGIP